MSARKRGLPDAVSSRRVAPAATRPRGSLARPWPPRRLVEMRPHRDAVAYVLSTLLVLFESPLLVVFATGAAITGVVRALAAMTRRRTLEETAGAAAGSR